MRLTLVVLFFAAAVMAEQIFAVRETFLPCHVVSAVANLVTRARVPQVELQNGQDPNAVAAAHGFHNLGQIGSLHNMYRFSPLNAGPHAARTVVSRSVALRGDPSVVLVEEQVKRQQHRRGPVGEENAAAEM